MPIDDGQYKLRLLLVRARKAKLPTDDIFQPFELSCDQGSVGPRACKGDD
jgi:hypothetical protein